MINKRGKQTDSMTRRLEQIQLRADQAQLGPWCHKPIKEDIPWLVKQLKAALLVVEAVRRHEQVSSYETYLTDALEAYDSREC